MAEKNVTLKIVDTKKLVYQAKAHITILECEDCTGYTENLHEHFCKDLLGDIIWEPIIINTQYPFPVSSSHEYILD